MYDWRPGPISHCQPAEVQIGVSFGYFRNHLKQVIYKKKKKDDVHSDANRPARVRTINMSIC